ncbi:MAG TPA: hypothetical protein VGF97_11110 [Rhizomicrobium sp.]|jgi:hypothetical protein
MLVLSQGGKSVALGRDTGMSLRTESGNEAKVFALESGDRLTFTRVQSRIPWPTPFELNFVTGHSPSWKRYRYWSLTLQKRSGPAVAMTWRYVEYYYEFQHGWADADMDADDPPTGLVRVTVSDGP